MLGNSFEYGSMGMKKLLMKLIKMQNRYDTSLDVRYYSEDYNNISHSHTPILPYFPR
jgi:hypothetical protein